MKLWCNVCDMNLVDQEDKSTGIVYKVEGHIADYKNKTLSDNYTIVVFSVCTECKLKETVTPTETKWDIKE